MDEFGCRLVLSLTAVSALGVTGCQLAEREFTPAPTLLVDGEELPLHAADLGPVADGDIHQPSSDPASEFPGTSRGAWTWVDMTGAITHFNEVALGQEGTSPAGMAMRTTGSNRLLIFLQGGNSCISVSGCEITRNKDGLGPDPWCDLNADADGTCDLDAARDDGKRPIDFQVFSDSEDNPFRGWNYVFVPYLSGDFFAGDNDLDVVIEGAPLNADPAENEAEEGSQPARERIVRRFQGRKNMLKYLDRIVAAYPDVDQVVVSGYSSGGVGAIYHFDRITNAFEAQNPGVETSLLVDSAFLPLEPDVMAPCVQRRIRDLFRLDRGLPPDCEDCFREDGASAGAYLRWLLERHARDHKIGFVISESDYVMLAISASGLKARNAARDWVACGKLDWISHDAPQMAARLLSQVPRLKRSLRSLETLVADYPNASMHVVRDAGVKSFQHVWFRSQLLVEDEASDGVRAYVREFAEPLPH